MLLGGWGGVCGASVCQTWVLLLRVTKTHTRDLGGERERVAGVAECGPGFSNKVRRRGRTPNKLTG